MSNYNKPETEQVATFFEGYASDFDSIYGHTQARNSFQKLVDKYFRKTMFLRFKETLKYVDNASIKSIIDIGCGPGHYCLEFLKRNKTVTGLDLSEGMLKVAQQNIAKANKKGEIKFIKADYLAYSFSEKFDAACLMGFFDYIKDPLPLVLKLKKDVSKEIYASFPKNSGPLVLQRKIRYRLRNCPLYLYSKKDVMNILNDAGIDQFEVKSCARDWFVRINF